MEWWIALIVVAALGIAAAAAVGGMGEMTKDPVRDVYRQDLPTRPLGAPDLDTIRFGITLRGYAMGQVDDLLDRVSAELAERDAVIAELTGGDPVAELEQRRQRPAMPPVEFASGWNAPHDHAAGDHAAPELGSAELVPDGLGSADLVPDDPMPGDRAGGEIAAEPGIDQTSAGDVRRPR